MTVLLLVGWAKGAARPTCALDSLDVTIEDGDEAMVLQAISGAGFSDRAS